MLNIRSDFPILNRKINGRDLIYLDSAATTQKPRRVIEAVKNYYENSNANIHRGLHILAEEATEKYEEVREKVRKFLNARSVKEIIFVRNATEAINLVAYSWGRLNLKKKDEIVTTVTEHHSNFVPWQQLALENGLFLKVLDINEQGRIAFLNENRELEKVISSKTKLVAMTQASNVLGTINPVSGLIRRIRQINPKTLILIDAAQSLPHFKIDVQDLDADFLAFSAHKMLGPTGVGVLYAKEKVLEEMMPFLLGGGMIQEVSLERTIYDDLPWRFEAGTPNVAGVIGFGATLHYLNEIGYSKIEEYLSSLTIYADKKLREIEGITLFGPENPSGRTSLFSFVIEDTHPHDVAQILNDRFNIAVRAGQHCAGPLHQRLGVPATCRASFYIYNTKEEIDELISALEKIKRIF